MYPLPPCRAADRDIFPVQSYLSQFAAEVLLQECQGKRHCTVPWVSAASTCHANSPHFVVLPYLQLVIVLIALITAILLTLISEPTHPHMHNICTYVKPWFLRHYKIRHTQDHITRGPKSCVHR